jgi:uncharacterized protein YjbI with pentapeptide repeats
MTSSSDNRAAPPAREVEANPWPPPPPFRGGSGLATWWLAPGRQLLLLIAVTLLALLAGLPGPALLAGALLLAVGLLRLLPPLWRLLQERLEDPITVRLLALLGCGLGMLAIAWGEGWLEPLLAIYRQSNWEAIGALGEGVIGAFGQILVALVALAIAWRQVMVDQRLTGQQNRITQAQTIDSLIDGLSNLISDEEGLLEDWPLERMLAEGRLAAVMGSIDAEGKARVLRFLSHARLLTPLRRDQRLGRAIFDGDGNYEEDRQHGVPVIQLRTILQGANLQGTDLRLVDFNRADLSGVNLAGADLRGANLAGTDLAGANLSNTLLEGACFFHGRAQTASPARPGVAMDPASGVGGGAVVVNADFRGARGLDAANHAYLAAWSGPRSRQSLPGGARGVPNRLDGWSVEARHPPS